MTTVAYVFVDDPDLARVAGRLKSFAGELTKNERGDFETSDRGYVISRAVALPDWPTIVKVYDGESPAKRRANAKRAFEHLKKHGDTALEANFDFERTLATFDPK